MGTPAKQPKRVKTRYVGIYYRHGSRRVCPDGKPDKCFDITYKNGDGKFVFEKIGWRSEGYTIQDALTIRNLRIKEIRHPELFPSPRPSTHMELKGITVEEAWIAYSKNWLPSLKSQYLTIKNYERHIKPTFGHRYILSISPIEIEQFKNNLLQVYMSSTVSKIINEFKRIINRAFKWNLLEGKNPLSGVTVKNSFNKRERYLTPKEAGIIIDGLRFVSCQLYNISKIALYTGMRLGEILHIKGYDIDLKQGLINVRMGKTGERTAYVPKSFEEDLAKIIPANLSNYIFSGNDGKPLSRTYVSQIFARFIECTGLNKSIQDARQKIVFHTFRHTFCSWLAIAGVPIYTISKLAGHKTITMTQRYAKLSPENQRDALQKLTIV